MKKITLSIIIVAVSALVLTGIVMAQDPTPVMPYGGGRHGGTGSGLLHDDMIGYLADAFGIQANELNARLDGGERMAQIAYSLGYSAEEFYQLMNQARLNALEDALADGVITQEQYNFMQSRAQSGHGGGFGAGYGAGGGQGRGGGRHHNGGGSGQFGDCPYYQDSSPNS